MATILAVDDSTTIIKLVSDILKNEGYDVLEAYGGLDGVALAKNRAPDAILLDRQMPDMNGNEALIALKADEKTKDIPVIMLTSDNRVGDVSTCFELGAVDYIVKPFDADNLLIRLKKALADARG